MRADGSIKSLTTGVSTVDKSRHGKRIYMQDCVNFRNDNIDGLSRRPPAQLTDGDLQYTARNGVLTTIDDFILGEDVLKPFAINNDKYWLYIQPSTGEMAIFDEDGTSIVMDVESHSYLSSVLGNDSIRFVNSGDVTYVVNTEATVEKTVGSSPIYRAHSMVVLRQSPKVYSTIKIAWENPDYTQSAIIYEVGEDHPIQPIPDVSEVDVGVNTLADYIAAKIDAKITATGNASVLEVDVEGSTIVFRNVAVGAAQRDFSRVSVEDGSGGAVASINGHVEGVEFLPRYSHPSALLEIRPDATSSRGRFYMKSESVLEALAPNPLPTPTTEITAGVNITDSGASHVSGYTTLFYTMGSITTTNIISGKPNHNVITMTMTTDNPILATNPTTVNVVITGPIDDFLDPDELQYLEFWDEASGASVRVAQVLMYQTSVFNNALYSIHVWEGTIDQAVVLTLFGGVDYKVYDYDVIEGYATVPEVRWVEESAPGQETLINHATFPHVLYRVPDGKFQFGSFNSVSTEAAFSLERRTSGDDVSNPFPTFVDHKVSDVAVFQNRLALLSDDRVSMSVTGQSNDWFRGTVTSLLATSPISIYSVSSRAASLTHFVSHNNDLMVFGPKGQFRFDGRLPLTPSNASLPQASSYPCDTLAVPQSSGNNVFFPTSYGASAGLSQFSLDPQIDNLSLARPMADLQIGLLPGRIQQIITAPNLGLILLRVQDVGNTLYVLEFEPQVDILKPIEPTWSRWELPWGIDIISMRIDEDTVEVFTVGDGVSSPTTKPQLYKLELFGNRRIKTETGQTFGDVHLDSRITLTGINTAVTLPASWPVGYSEAPVVVQGIDCPQPGQAVSYTVGETAYDLILDADMGGGSVYVGFTYVSSITLPDLHTTDESGIIQTGASLRITDFNVTFTGHIDAQVDLLKGTNYPVQEYRGIPEGLDYVGYGRTSWRVQFKQDSTNGILTLKTSSHIACDMHQVEWRGTYFKAGRRF